MFSHIGVPYTSAPCGAIIQDWRRYLPPIDRQISIERPLTRAWTAQSDAARQTTGGYIAFGAPGTMKANCRLRTSHADMSNRLRVGRNENRNSCSRRGCSAPRGCSCWSRIPIIHGVGRGKDDLIASGHAAVLYFLNFERRQKRAQNPEKNQHFVSRGGSNQRLDARFFQQSCRNVVLPKRLCRCTTTIPSPPGSIGRSPTFHGC